MHPSSPSRPGGPAACGGSQIIEDCVHYSKAMEAKANSKRVCDLRLYQCPIRRKVAEEVHRFSPPVCSKAVVASRNVSVSDEVFQIPINKVHPRLSEVKGYNTTPSWYSPPPEQRVVLVSDLELAKYLETASYEHLVGNVDMICLLRGQNSLIVRDKAGHIGDGHWMLPICILGTQCAIGWVVELMKMDGGPVSGRRDYFDFKRGQGWVLIYLAEPKDFEARRFE